MVALARALVPRPKLLLLDEPSLGLAPVVTQAVFQIIAEIQTRGTTVLLVEQNALMALSIAFAVGFCLLGAFLPAHRAARMEPASALVTR